MVSKSALQNHISAISPFRIVHIETPKGFSANGWHIGLKAKSKRLDFGVLHSHRACNAAAIFTRNNLVGWPAHVGRRHAAEGKIRTVIVNSGNANTATGPGGLKLVEECCQLTAESLGIASHEVLPASTGIIGQSLEPQKEILFEACRSIPKKIEETSFENFSQAICTTDAYPKSKSIKLKEGLCITGVAKGAGMIQPNMATMLAFLCTDAQIEVNDLRLLIEALSNRSFNRISVDSDTSTSDTFAILANGESGTRVSFGPKVAQEFQKLHYPISMEDLLTIPELRSDQTACSFLLAVLDICVTLACMIVQDGEGSEKLLELRVKKARDTKQALKIGRSILNSPLCKTALYGCDPNWGRVLMAIGKVFDEPIDRDKLKVYFGEHRLFPQEGTDLNVIAEYLKNERLEMRVELGEGDASETLWGCDLNENYVHLNSAYTS